MTQQFEFAQGDEVVLVRRRTRTIKNPETQLDEISIENTDVSIVRVPQNFLVYGSGSLQPEYHADPKNESRDRQELVIRYPIRLS